MIVDLPVPFPAFAILLCGEPFMVVFDSGEGIRLMAAPPTPQQVAAEKRAEARFGQNRNRWVDGVKPRASARTSTP